MILLIHHGVAADATVDAMRPLTEAGRTRSAALGERIAARGVVPDALWHSGKIRARQTAELIGRSCNPRAPLLAVRGLQPDDPPTRIQDRLAGETATVALVGHMPNLPRLLHALTAASASDAPLASFPQHGCVALTWNDDRWIEVWRLEGW
jgi:phosphohistidine phosphatase